MLEDLGSATLVTRIFNPHLLNLRTGAVFAAMQGTCWQKCRYPGHSLVAKASGRKYVRPGGLIKVSALVAPRNKTVAYTGLSFEIQMPAGTTYWSGKATGFKPRLAAPVVDTQGGTVSWISLPDIQGGKRKRRFAARFKVASTVPAGTALVFDAYVYETGTDCLYHAPRNVTVSEVRRTPSLSSPSPPTSEILMYVFANNGFTHVRAGAGQID